MSAKKIPSILVLCGAGVPLLDNCVLGGESNRLGRVMCALRREASLYGYDVIGLKLEDPGSLVAAIQRAPNDYVAVIFDLGAVGLDPSVRSEIESIQVSGFLSQEMSYAERQGLPQSEFEGEYVDMVNMLIGELILGNSRQRIKKAA